MRDELRNIARKKGGAKSDGLKSLPIGLVGPTSKPDLGVMPFKICTVHANRLGIDQNLTHSGQNPQICRCRIFVTCSCHNQGNSHPMFKFCTSGHGHYICIL